ncbi:hypothetical protein [Candidatus Amarobacter glycogenicus]|uniref:hypothetical protein n=1 Tax=Candidatus Amarobacter glycogenicus TaxID=3140699 RepID=UPI002A1321EF|nr:hypothetical protein [Dehalococcoidia bacterium]
MRAPLAGLVLADAATTTTTGRSWRATPSRQTDKDDAGANKYSSAADSVRRAQRTSGVAARKPEVDGHRR